MHCQLYAPSGAREVVIGKTVRQASLFAFAFFKEAAAGVRVLSGGKIAFRRAKACCVARKLRQGEVESP